MSKDVAKNIPVSVSGLTLGGTQGGEYTLTQPTTTANITPATLIATGVTANNKVYNQSTAAIIESSPAARWRESLCYRHISRARPWGNITVTVTGLTLSGGQAVDYTPVLNQAKPTANITSATLTATGITADKVYDGTTSATLNTSSAALMGLFSGDVVTLVHNAATGTFASKNVGNNILVSVSGLSLNGGQSSDYTLTPADDHAHITVRGLTITATTATKTYDSTTSAAATPTVAGLVDNDTVTGLEREAFPRPRRSAPAKR